MVEKDLMTWQIFIALSVVFYSISVLLQRSILKESNSQPVAFSIFFQLLVGIIIGITGFFLGQSSLPPLGPFAFFLALVTCLYGFGNAFLFKSLQITEASKFTVLFSCRAFFTILASTLFLQEGLGPKQLVGVLCIFSAVAIVSLKSTRFEFNKGDLFALIAAMCMGLANTIDRHLLQHLLLYPYVSFSFIVPSLFTAVMQPKEVKHLPLFWKKNLLPKVLLLCFLYSLAAITFYNALFLGTNSSQVISVNLTNVIVITVLSIFFLKERDNIPKKVIGAALSFVGLLLLS